MADQDSLFVMPETTEPTAPPDAGPARQAPPAAPKLKAIDRRQSQWISLDVDTLVAPDHCVRAIWELTGKLDLSRFLEKVKSRQGAAGREHLDPRLLIAIWLYAYSQGISAAREVGRQMGYEPGFRWLNNVEEISYATLSEFRKNHRPALDEIFVQQLAVLEQAGMVDLEQVMHDGTKIQAQGSGSSFRREKTIVERLEKARAVVQELSDPEAEAEEATARQQARRQRAAAERVAVLEAALREVESVQASKAKAAEQAQARVSLTEPECRMMQHGNDGGISASYNVQVTTDGKERVIVAVELTQSSSDGAVELSEVVQAVEEHLERKPKQMVVDGGFTNQKNIVGMAQAAVDLVGSMGDQAAHQAAARKASGVGEGYGSEQFTMLEGGRALQCPAGHRLDYVGEQKKRGNLYAHYQAQGRDCGACAGHLECCPKGYAHGRSVTRLRQEQAEVAAFREKMASAAAQQAYRRRSEVAEFPNLWIKEKMGIRKFRLRGMGKATIEALWACLTYNVMQWIRLVWRRQRLEGSVT
jgi:transposase